MHGQAALNDWRPFHVLLQRRQYHPFVRTRHVLYVDAIALLSDAVPHTVPMIGTHMTYCSALHACIQ